MTAINILLVIVYAAAVKRQSSRDVLIRSSVPKVIRCISCTCRTSAAQIHTHISAKTTFWKVVFIHLPATDICAFPEVFNSNNSK